MSKGSGRRPKQITEAEEQARWDLAFGKKDKNGSENKSATPRRNKKKNTN